MKSNTFIYKVNTQLCKEKMDFLKQCKLSKREWESLEVPLPEKEKRVMNLIHEGYGNTSVVQNYTINMMTFTKLPISTEMFYFIYLKYFKSIIEPLQTKYNLISNIETKTIKKLKSADSIRVQHVDQSIQSNIENIFEFVCLNYCKKILKLSSKNTEGNVYLYTLIQWTKSTIKNNNPYVMDFIHQTIEYGRSRISKMSIVQNASNIIEKNPKLYLYEDMVLYPHQKEIFTVCKMNKDTPKLILYTAPTGTGKTLTPIGLSNGYKIIFVCVARHIGLALAKSAICIDKKVAFAFGCETASDIRLHYFAAVDYQKNKRSGGIGKVDNSNGSEVEIMICDVQSYLIAMYYMISFNNAENIIMYWDEPTMTLDYETHDIHQYIHRNWVKNEIPNVILSCATLPSEESIHRTLQDFCIHFPGAMIHTITSYDCKKSIPMITTNGTCFVPHTHCTDYNIMKKYISYCQKNKTLLRYFDLDEIVQCIMRVHENLSLDSNFHIENYFDSVEEITMNSLKVYYLEILYHMDSIEWSRIFSISIFNQKRKYLSNKETNGSGIYRTQSLPNQENIVGDKITRNFSESHVEDKIKNTLEGVLLTTKDAHTLTDGPTIYLVDNILNIAKFYVQQSKIPSFILKQLLENIQQNNVIRESIESMEEELALKLQVKDNTDSNNKDLNELKKKKTPKQPNEKSGNDENTQVLKENIEQLKKQLYYLSLLPEYIPNKPEHKTKWSPNVKDCTKPFSSNIDEATVKEIMNLDIQNDYKLLVLMGIGILIEQHNKEYEEIVKRLAQEQKLYLILASSDFIYGTNYQFCHGFIGKDLPNMTPQKILQSMGRIGRNSSQQDYSVRFRNDEMIHRLFTDNNEFNMEAVNMNMLLVHDE
uniref:Helicase ATP-binding domain-containing protein n=1 Tax=viral metagenome TaxID=1070528 RepID=A0A6C0CNZ2_9ZZZZ